MQTYASTLPVAHTDVASWTACLAITHFFCRPVSAEEYAAWEPVYRAAKTALHDRDARLDAAAELIERDLLLLGATAIEDKLQEARA